MELQNEISNTETKKYNAPPIEWRRLFPAWVDGDKVFIRITRNITLEGFVLKREADSVLFDWGGVRYEATKKTFLSDNKFKI